MPLAINSQPDGNCIISKKDCNTICIENTDLVISQGTPAQAVFIWVEASVGATGTILDKEFTLDVANTGTTFDGTIAGFQTMLEIAFPDYLGGTFLTILDGAAKVLLWTFPNNEELSNFVFFPNSFGINSIASNAINGTDPELANCKFYPIMYDADTDELICKLDVIEPEFVGDNPILTTESCFRAWDARQSLTLPTLDVGTITTDDTFCKRIYFRITERCEDDEGCFNPTTQVITNDITVVDSELGNLDDYCVFSNVDSARFMTELDCVKICKGVEAWLWICPNLHILDDFGFTYSYSALYTYYDKEGNNLGTTAISGGATNTAYVVPTGSNFFDNLPVPPNPNISYYTVEFLIRVNGGAPVSITSPVTYQYIECCCDETLYFKEEAGGLSQICMTVKKRVGSVKSDEVCVEGDCGCEVKTTGAKKTRTVELEAFCDDEQLVEVFSRAKKHYLIINDELQEISIKEKNIDFDLYNEETPNISITAKIACE